MLRRGRGFGSTEDRGEAALAYEEGRLNQEVRGSPFHARLSHKPPLPQDSTPAAEASSRRGDCSAA